MLYLNMLVLIVQAFLKVPPLHALAPTGSGPAFLAAEAVTLVVFVTPGFCAAPVLSAHACAGALAAF